MHSLVPFPCLSEQPQPLCVLAVGALLLPAGALTALMVLFSVRQGNRHQLLIFCFVHCKQRSQRGQKFSLFGPSVFLPFLCLFPLLALFSIIPSAPSPSLGEPGNSTGASWALLFLKNFLLPPVLVFCNSQFIFSFSQSAGFVTKQSHGWGLHIYFVKEQGNMPRDLLHTNTPLWWGGMWSSSRTVWENRLLHSFASPSPLFVMPIIYVRKLCSWQTRKTHSKYIV